MMMNTILDRLKSAFLLTRPINLCILFLAQLTTFIIIQGWGVFGDYSALLLMVSTLLIAAAGYLINDFYDQEIDRINRPLRFGHLQKFTEKQILGFYIFFNSLGIVLLYNFPMEIILLHFFCIILLWLYSFWLKRIAFLGNISIAILSAFAIFDVGVYRQQWNKQEVLFFLFFAFLLTLIREIIKDIEDIEGDQQAHCHTLPIVLGNYYTKIIIMLIVLVFIGVVSMQMFYATTSFFWTYYGIHSISGWCFLFFVFFAEKKSDYTKLSLYTKVLMLLGIVGMLFFHLF